MIIELEDNARLNVSLMQGNGVYRVYVRKEFVEVKELDNGAKYQTITTIPFADGNFFVKVGEGRKSQKKLDDGEKYLEENKDNIKASWLAGDYYAVAMILMGTMLKRG